MLVDYRDQLSSRRVQTINRLHRLLAELTPGKAKKDSTALEAKAILAGVRPRDVAGKTRRQVAADGLAELIAVERKVEALTLKIKAIVKQRRSNLMELPGVGPVVAARILADCRRHRPLRRPQPLRVLDRYCTPGCVLRRQTRY